MTARQASEFIQHPATRPSVACVLGLLNPESPRKQASRLSVQGLFLIPETARWCTASLQPVTVLVADQVGLGRQGNYRPLRKIADSPIFSKISPMKSLEAAVEQPVHSMTPSQCPSLLLK